MTYRSALLFSILIVFSCKSAELYRIEKGGILPNIVYVRLDSTLNDLIIFQILKGQIGQAENDTLRHLDSTTLIGKISKIIRKKDGIEIEVKSRFVNIKSKVAQCACQDSLNTDFNKSCLFENRFTVINKIDKVIKTKFPNKVAVLYYDSILDNSNLKKFITLPPELFKSKYESIVDAIFQSLSN